MQEGAAILPWVAATFHHWNPNISKMLEKIRKLNSKGIHFKSSKNWMPDIEEEFQKLKAEICQAFKKKPFYPRRGVLVFTNASKKEDWAMWWPRRRRSGRRQESFITR